MAAENAVPTVTPAGTGGPVTLGARIGYLFGWPISLRDAFTGTLDEVRLSRFRKDYHEDPDGDGMSDVHELIRSVESPEGEPFPQGNPERVNLRAAVVVNGGDDDQGRNRLFHDAAKLAYFGLRAVGYSHESILFHTYTTYLTTDLDTEDFEGIADRRSNQNDVGVLAASPAVNFVELLQHLQISVPAEISGRDVFGFNFVDHGWQRYDWGGGLSATTCDALGSGWLTSTGANPISPSDLSGINSSFDAYRKVFTLGTCHSGGMIGSEWLEGIPDPAVVPPSPPCKISGFSAADPESNYWFGNDVYSPPGVSGPRTVIMASVRWDEGNNWPWFESFHEALFHCDLSSDAICSYEEAFRSAWEAIPPEETAHQHPPLDDNADFSPTSPGQVGYAPDTVGADGYLSRRTYR